MKLHWKVAMVMLIGLLIAGQVVTLKYAAAQSSRMANAAEQLRIANKELKAEEDRLQAILAKWTKMNSMSMSGFDKEIMSLLRDFATDQVDTIRGTRAVLGALDNVVREVAKQK